MPTYPRTRAEQALPAAQDKAAGRRPRGARSRYGRDMPTPALITAADPAAFAHSVFHLRHPKVIAQVKAGLPYGPERLAALDAFLDETLHAALAPLPEDDAGDRAQWDRWGAPYFGQDLRWTDAPFLWAESYFHRRLLSATGYFAGPWRGVDPFWPMKSASLTGAGLAAELAGLGSTASAAPAERDAAALHASLWGNRADLGFQLVAGAPVVPEVLVDDGPAIWAHLEARPGRVNLVADNAAEELVYDLLLIDHLLASGRASGVALYLKPRPYYVSDATSQDFAAAVHLLGTVPGPASEAAARLRAHCAQGRLTISAPEFFCAPLEFDALPKDLLDALATAVLTIFKGDLNYRRLVGDRLWPEDTPFRALTSYLPGPVAALRTYKSEVSVGMDPDTAGRLDAAEPGWRFGGRHAVIQFSGR